VYGSRRRSLIRIRIAGRAALIAAASLAAGCAAPRNHLHQRSSAEFQRAVVLPLNLVARMAPELRDGASRVDRELLRYLAERGKAIDSISTAEAYSAWRASEADCQSQGEKDCDRFLGVARAMAQRLRRDRDYQTLIVPYLMMRDARCRSSTVLWDGVQRPVETAGRSFEPDGPMRVAGGRIRAVSLKVYAFSADGERVFEGIGGLDVVDRVSAEGDPPLVDYEVREQLLGDPALLREGVELALEKLVARPRAGT
jgi:hypothetical protein